MENSSRAHSGVRSTNAWNQTHISGNASVHQGDVFQVGSDLEKVCLSRLRVVDPRDHGAGIERKKGGLCEEAFKWILDTPGYKSFTNWNESEPTSQHCRLLWIKGHAGTSKTMLMIGILREISHQSAKAGPPASYFFCQGTDKALNNATAVLRSLIWLFAVQQPDIMSPLLERYKVSGTELFTDGNSFDALSAIFQAMLKDSNMSPMYFAIDALDECDENQSDLIKIIATSLTISSKVKWLLASRPEVDVLAKLKTYDLPDLCIPKALVELDTESLQAPASAYIEHRLKKLKRSSNVGSTYTEAILETVLKEVRERAKDNFLWVSLVFDDLETMRGPYAINQVLGYPSGLSQLYDHRMDRIERKETGVHAQRCRDVLSTVLLAYRPLSLDEIAAIVPWGAEVDPIKAVNTCTSFLTITTGSIINLTHQSAKDYLERIYESRLHSEGLVQGHRDIGRRAIEAMSLVLACNMYKLDFSDEPRGPLPGEPDPLAPIRYSCTFWADHLCYSNGQSPAPNKELIDGGSVLPFLKEHLLYWLESLSLLGQVSQGAVLIGKLLHISQSQAEMSPGTIQLLEDTHSFIRNHGQIIARAPLQIYGSALIFSPSRSEVKKLYWKNRLPFIKTAVGIGDHWEERPLVLKGEGDDIEAVIFSPNGRTLVSCSGNGAIQLWDTSTGVAGPTFQSKIYTRSYFAATVAFSPDGSMLSSPSGRGTITLWNVEGGTACQTIQMQGVFNHVEAATFSYDGKLLASTWKNGAVQLWDVSLGTVRETYEHKGWHRAVAFSPDGKLLASATFSRGVVSVRLWDVVAGAACQTFQKPFAGVAGVAFSPDCRMLALSLQNRTLWLWDIVTGAAYQTPHKHGNGADLPFSPLFFHDVSLVVAFSPDSRILASALSTYSPTGLFTPRQTRDRTIQLSDISMNTAHLTLHAGHNIQAMAFSPDGRILASASGNTVRFYSIDKVETRQTDEGKNDGVRALAFSPDRRLLASVFQSTIQLWDTATAEIRQIIPSPTVLVTGVAFSPDSRMLALLDSDSSLQLWDTVTTEVRQTLRAPSPWAKLKNFPLADPERALAFSPSGRMLALLSDRSLQLWDTTTGEVRKRARKYDSQIRAVAFSLDGKLLAVVSFSSIQLWDTATAKVCQTLPVPDGQARAEAFSPDGKILASVSGWLLQLWDTAAAEVSQGFPEPGSQVRTVRILPCDKIIPRYSDKEIQGEGADHSDNWLVRDMLEDLEYWHTSAITVQKGWISLKGKDVIGLPPNYNPECTAIHGCIVAMGYGDGQTVLLDLEELS